MNEVQKVNLRRTADWLASEVDIRIQRKWLLVAAVAVAFLALLALD